MKRILDIDKILEKEKQKTYWQRIKSDPVKFGHYRRKQYVNKKKEKEAHHHPSLLYHLRKFVRI